LRGSIFSLAVHDWGNDGVERTYNDRFPGHSIFISNDNPLSGRSLEFACLLGAQLKSRGLKYRHRRREIVDAARCLSL
jgi:hypothetical protein